MAIILGEVWFGPHKGEYLIFIDCDNLKAIEEFCTRNGKTVSITEIAQKMIVVDLLPPVDVVVMLRLLLLSA